MAKPKVFLDSSVLIAAVLSSSGGSFYILTHFRDKCEFQINEYVLEEILRVLNQKFRKRPDLKTKLFLILGLARVEILPNPSRKEVRALGKVISKEDVPILASAIQNSSYLITLDNEFLGKEVHAFAVSKGLSILKPRDFIQKFR